MINLQPLRWRPPCRHRGLLRLPGTEVEIHAAAIRVAHGEIPYDRGAGDNVFQGYWNMPEKTAEESCAETGFFIHRRSGRDGAGTRRISIVRRQKDLIISG